MGPDRPSGVAALVLVAGGDDRVWPSLHMADSLVRRREQLGLVTSLVSAPDAGHRTLIPGEQPVAAGMSTGRGGTEAADRDLGSAAWEQVVALL